MLLKIPVGLNAILIAAPALLVNVTEFCVVVRMQPSGVASLSVMLMFWAVALSSNGMTRAAMAGSFFELNLLTFRWAENWDPIAGSASPDLPSCLQDYSPFAGSSRYTAMPRLDHPGLHRLRRHILECRDRPAKARVPIVCEKWPFREAFSWRRPPPNRTAPQRRAVCPEPSVQ